MDGTRQAIHTANEMFQMLLVPAGANSIHLQYRPVGFTLGVWISTLALLVLLCLLLGSVATRSHTGTF